MTQQAFYAYIFPGNALLAIIIVVVLTIFVRLNFPVQPQSLQVEQQLAR